MCRWLCVGLCVGVISLSQAYFKHISDGCKLETLADRGMATIKVE